MAPHFSQRSAVLPRPFSPKYWTHVMWVPSAEQGYTRVFPFFTAREANLASFFSPLAISHFTSFLVQDTRAENKELPNECQEVFCPRSKFWATSSLKGLLTERRGCLHEGTSIKGTQEAGNFHRGEASGVTEGTGNCFEVGRGRSTAATEDPRIGSQQGRDVANHSFRIQRIDPFSPSVFWQPRMGLANQWKGGHLSHLSEDFNDMFHMHAITSHDLGGCEFPNRLLGGGPIEGEQAFALLEKDQTDCDWNGWTFLGRLKSHPGLGQMRHALNQDEINASVHEVRKLLFKCGTDFR